MCRDIGTMGETLIQLWCAQVGIAANKSTMDRTGWDFMLEFPFAENAGKEPLDQMSPPVSCRIQVKSTDSSPPSAAIKVSNWHRMISDSQPFFVVFLNFSGKKECQDAHILHVDEGYIEKVLKKCRELEESGAGNELNKHFIIANARDGKPLPSLDGQGLKSVIQHFVGSSMDEYTTKKIRARNNVGYDEQRTVIKCEIARDARYSTFSDQMMDFALRRIDNLPISSATVTEKRFGIESKKTEKVFKGGGTIHHANNNPDGLAWFYLRDSTRDLTISISLNLYLPHGIPANLKKLAKARLATQFIEMFLPFSQEGKPVFNFRLPHWDEKSSLNELKKVADLIHFLAGSKDGESFEWKVTHDENQAAHGCIQFHHSFSKDVLDAVKSIMLAGTILKHMNSKNDELVRVGELSGQLPVLIYVAESLEEANPQILIEYSADDEIDYSRSLVVPDVRQVFIGDQNMLFGIAVHGKPGDASLEEKGTYRVRMFPCNPVVCIKEAYPRGTALPTSFAEFKERIVNMHKDSCDLLILSSSVESEDSG